MPKKTYSVELTEKERTQLERYVKQGTKSARSINRARILLLSDEEHRDEDIMEIVGICRQTMYSVRKRYQQHKGHHILDLLQEKPRPGQPVKVDSGMAAHVAMIAGSEAPAGAAPWTLPLIADRLIALKVVDSMCVESVRRAVKKTN